MKVGIWNASFFCMPFISDELSIMNRMSTFRSPALASALVIAASSVSTGAPRSGGAHDPVSARATQPARQADRRELAATGPRQFGRDARRALRRRRRPAIRNAKSNVGLQALGPEPPMSQPPLVNPLCGLPEEREPPAPASPLRPSPPGRPGPPSIATAPPPPSAAPPSG